VSADIFNSGSTGFAPVFLYINGKVFQTKEFPVIKNNSRRIEFVFRLLNSGRQEIAIGETPAQMVNVVGEKPSVVFDLIRVSEERVLSGECIKVSATARNVQQVNYQSTIRLYVNGRVLKSLSLLLKPMEEKEVQFEIFPEVGVYPVRIENSSGIMVTVSRYRELDLKKEKLLTYLSAKSKPANVLFDPINGSYKIAAAGSDFFHAEDAYAAVYLRQLKGDFVAKVKVDAFGEKTEAWFRAGLYARNDITQSFDVVKGSLGSVLMFTTPNRAGIEYDEFGDGSMHKAASENLPENTTMPVWLKLERHGNTYSGYVSVDGKNWIIQRKSTPLPGLTEAVDLGLAAGSSNGKQYAVTFSGWSVKVQE
jgi:regulation of enolase protein 1 (concanavalin A-like superfamily)